MLLRNIVSLNKRTNQTYPSYLLITIYLTILNKETTDLDVEIREKENERDHVTYLEVQPPHGDTTWPYDSAQ